jgi:putative ABC transport system permease protein
MIKNYFKIAIRNLLHYKWNSVFNILGLSIGIACFIYIFFLLKYELNYDGFHKNIERIYRIPMTLKVEGRTTHYAGMPSKYGRYIKNNFDEIEKFARIRPSTTSVFSYKDKKFIEENFKYAEQDILSIFTFDFIYGSPNNALSEPFTAIINENIAYKYFGEENPIGKMLKIDTAYFEVTGVFKELPKNSRLKLDVFLSFVTGNPDQYNDWRAGGFTKTFVKLKEGINPSQLEKKLLSVPQIVNAETLKERGEQNIPYLQALKNIHTDTTYDYTWDTEPITNPAYIYILFITGLFILLIASLNFINLSTAKYISRAKEVVIRKIVGATRRQLIFQFLGESILIVFVAHIIGMFLIEFTIGYFNQITQLNFSINYLDLNLWLIICGLILFIGLLAGSYPAFLLSSFKPNKQYSNKSFNKGLRKVLVIIQYTVTIILLIGTIFIYKQVNFMINAPLGFSKDQKLVMEFPRDLINGESYKTVKNEFNQLAGIQTSCFSSSVPGRWRYKWRICATGLEEQSKHIYCTQIDNDYFDVYNINLVKGERYFTENTRDSDWILNEAGIDIYGWSLDSALYQSLEGRHNIKAVVQDYHFEGLQKLIEPLAFFKIEEDFRYLTIQLEKGNVAQLLNKIESKFNDMYPDLVFNYFFLDQDFERQYQTEKRIVKVFSFFTTIGLIISIIGIFGLAVFTCQQMEKEIGIRKVNGATGWDIFSLISFSFSRWIFISFLIAVPIVYMGINSWIKDFAYRIEISWALILFSGFIAWFIAILTVSYQTVKSARKNPVDSLRFE